MNITDLLTKRILGEIGNESLRVVDKELFVRVESFSITSDAITIKLAGGLSQVLKVATGIDDARNVEITLPDTYTKVSLN